MTVSTTSSAVSFTGNGSTTEFDFTFKVSEEGDIDVTLYNTTTQATTAVSSGSYSVALNADNTGTVTYPLSGSPIDSNTKIILERVVPYTQPLEINNQDGFNPEEVEDQLDRMVMMIQQIANDSDLALKLPPGDDFTILVLPYTEDRAEKYVYFDSTGELSLTGTAPAVQYQGAFTTANEPTLRLGGSALQAGDLYFNTTVTRLKVYTGATWTNGVDSSSAIDINGMTALGGAIASGDFIPIYDLSNTANRKATPQEIVDFLGSVSTETAILTTGDLIPFYDASATAMVNITFTDFMEAVNSLTADASPDGAADYVLSYDASASTVKRVLMDDLPSASGTDGTAITHVNTTSGTTVTVVSGLGTGINRVLLEFNNVSTDGSAEPIIQLGDSGGLETTGYISDASDGGGTQSTTTGFLIARGSSASSDFNGHMLLTRKASSNIWMMSGTVSENGVTAVLGGTKELSSDLTQIELTTIASDTFDQGTIGGRYW